jgi:hypothetical protein
MVPVMRRNNAVSLFAFNSVVWLFVMYESVAA